MNKRKILTFITALTMSLTSLSFTPAYVVAEDSTAAVAASEENKGIYFSDKEDASIRVETGFNSGISLQGCNDDKFYEIGESPVKFTIDNENIAKITQIQGYLVNVRGVSAGETVLRAETSDGQKASVKIVSVVTPVTTTTVWTNTTTATATYATTSTVIYDYAPTVEFDTSPMKVGEVREGKFYNPETKKTDGGSVYAVFETVKVEYTEGSDTFKVTALEPGRAHINFGAKGCAFMGSVEFKVVDENGDSPTTTTTKQANSQTTYLTTATTTSTSTTNVIYDFWPTVELDKSPMQVGEVREGRFYNPETKKTEGGSVYSASDNIMIEYTKGSDTFRITALKAGKASITFSAKGCAFNNYVSLEVTGEDVLLPDFAPTVDFDTSDMKVGETRKGRFYNPISQKSTGGNIKASDNVSVKVEKDGSFEVTALKAGSAKLEITDNDCPFTGSVYFNVVEVSKMKGDSNCDGQMDMSDVVLIMQALANPNKYGENGTAKVHLTAQGKENADMDGNGLTVGDAQKIQMKLLGLDDDSEPLTPLAQAVGVDTTDEAIKLIRSYDLNDYNVNARETMKQMFESFKKDGFIYRFAEVTGDDAVKLRDDYVNPPVCLGPYANFEDIGILYHVKAYDMNYQLYYFNRGKDYAGQSMSDYIKNRFGFNVTKVIDDKYFIFDSSKDGQNDISVIFALDDGHYCKVRCFGTEAELMKLAKSLKSVKLPLGLNDTDDEQYERTVDWYYSNVPSGVYEKCRENGKNTVITDKDELKEYIEQYAPAEKVAPFLEKYNDSFFRDNVLLIDSVNQNAGAVVGYEFKSVNISDEEINITLKNLINYDTPQPAMMSLCIAQVSVPKEKYSGQPVNWKISSGNISDLNDINNLLLAYSKDNKLPVSMITSISQGDKQVYVYLGTFDIKEQEKVIEQMKNYMKFMNIDEELVCFAIPQTVAD